MVNGGVHSSQPKGRLPREDKVRGCSLGDRHKTSTMKQMSSRGTAWVATSRPKGLVELVL